MDPQRSYGEPVGTDFDHVFRGRLLHEERSQFQHLQVYEHVHFGRMLMLDGVVQTTERDEYCYHEMLVHPALASLDRLERVLVIGGGDGGTLRRVLEHQPTQAVMCEIDEAVTRVSRELLPGISAGAFDDERATVVFEDGAAYADRHFDLFDAIIVDSTDPVGAAVVLFSREFYESCRTALRPGGILVAQTGTPLYQEREFRTALGNMSQVFGVTEVYQGFVPTYPGVVWSFTLGTEGDPPSAATPEQVETRLRERGISTRFYHPGLHRACFALPAFLRDVISEERAATSRRR